MYLFLHQIGLCYDGQQVLHKSLSLRPNEPFHNTSVLLLNIPKVRRPYDYVHIEHIQNRPYRCLHLPHSSVQNLLHLYLRHLDWILQLLSANILIRMYLFRHSFVAGRTVVMQHNHNLLNLYTSKQQDTLQLLQLLQPKLQHCRQPLLHLAYHQHM